MDSKTIIFKDYSLTEVNSFSEYYLNYLPFHRIVYDSYVGNVEIFLKIKRKKSVPDPFYEFSF